MNYATIEFIELVGSIVFMILYSLACALVARELMLIVYEEKPLAIEQKLVSNYIRRPNEIFLDDREMLALCACLAVAVAFIANVKILVENL